jgi:6-phosphofructokinase
VLDNNKNKIMDKNINHISVFTSGGDSSEMNAALSAIAKAAEINGGKRDMQGLLRKDRRRFSIN